MGGWGRGGGGGETDPQGNEEEEEEEEEVPVGSLAAGISVTQPIEKEEEGKEELAAESGIRNRVLHFSARLIRIQRGHPSLGHGSRLIKKLVRRPRFRRSAVRNGGILSGSSDSDLDASVLASR